MATLFSLHPSPVSSSFASLHPFSPLKCLSSPRTAKPDHHFNRQTYVHSLHSPGPDSLRPSVQRFWQWLQEEGVVSAKTPVKPSVVPEGLGMVAQRDIAENEVVLQVPRRLWINPDTVLDSEIGSVCRGCRPWVSVALFLIRERSKDDSRWRHYLDVLPEYTNSPIFWSEEELSEIQGTQLLRATLDMKEYLKNKFLHLDEAIILPNKQLFNFPITVDDLFWAFGIIRSRAFSRLWNQSLVLIPLVDLLNHSPSITTEDYASEVTGSAGLFSWDLLFTISSPVFVKAGEQVFIQYNLNKSNSELALDYGFIESTSERNVYTLMLELSESDPFFQDKLGIAVSNGLGKTASFIIKLSGSLPPNMLPYLRLVSLGGNDAFLLESPFRNSIWGHLQLTVSHANEELVCQVVRSACKSLLSGYNTTIEEDEEVKEDGILDPRLEIAVGIRLAEKKILQQLDHIFEQRELELAGRDVTSEMDKRTSSV